ncbi:MAG TPA: DoxX family protein [Chthoniobacteraceae bacterium]|nr:DoxX family protein [Chthoniobacteraceae bacterium]
MKAFIDLFAKAYGLLVRGAGYLQHPLLLIIRLYWGWETFDSGRSHLGNVPAMVERFKGWHIPFPEANVYLSGYTELLCGILLLLGLASRIITIPLICNFIVAYLTASHDTIQQSLGAIFSKPDDFTGDTSFLFLLASVLVFVFGPGMFSLDWVMGKIYRGKKKAE